MHFQNTLWKNIKVFNEIENWFNYSLLNYLTWFRFILQGFQGLFIPF